jgi:hydrogenase maturation protein HypF
MKADIAARRLEINGIVQGVGFRPFIFQLAQDLALTGNVANTATGVSILIEGPRASLDAFVGQIRIKPPPLSHITEITSHPEPVAGHESFTIVKSRSDRKKATLISPDVSICEDCHRELLDARDRRFRYPFINCTNCGPRYTIIDNIPYDRPYTSMRHFTMCPQCQSEYDDPHNRRFHAQPNACPVCGPQVELLGADGRSIVGDPVDRTIELIKAGHILAIKGLGGFHLAVDAQNSEAVSRLRQRKHREEKPFALMARDIQSIDQFARVSPHDRELLLSIRRPIVLMPKIEPNPIASGVAPRNRYFGVMLPYTPLHYLLMEGEFTALVMTSGNISEEPICIDNADALDRLGDIADYFLIHDRDIYLRSDDSIVRHAAGALRPIRRSRGYVPVPIFLKHPQPAVLACGAELKNTICLTKGKNAFVSQHIGDLENLATYQFFQLTVDHMQRILDVTPERLACDLHPDYLSTRYAREQTGVPVHRVQHHHAHIASCMAENHVDEKVIGLALDGTGYGPDGAVWGGEILIADLADYRRAAHFEYVPMPGSAAAIKAPWRMGISYLMAAYGEAFEELDLPLLHQTKPQDRAVIVQMLNANLNSPSTSSLGRLFDGVAALLGVRGQVAFEGQAAMELEMICDGGNHPGYEISWSESAVRQIHLSPLIKGVVNDLIDGRPEAHISARFHATLVDLFARMCHTLRDETGIDNVALSGGVFQNMIMLNRLSQRLETMGFEVLTHKRVPANDGGIALGQAVVAAQRPKNPQTGPHENPPIVRNDASR